MQITDSDRNIVNDYPPMSGIAAATSQGTAATDNIAYIMKNTVIIGLGMQTIGMQLNDVSEDGTSDVRRESRY